MSRKFSDYSSVFSYAMLSNKVYQVLCRIANKRDVGENGYEVLEKGRSIIKDIIMGSMLIDNKAVSGFTPSQKGLFAYKRGLSTIKKLELLKDSNDLTDIFLEYNKSLSILSSTHDLPKKELSHLKNFFEILDNMFSDDLMEDTYTEPIRPENRKSIKPASLGEVLAST